MTRFVLIKTLISICSLLYSISTHHHDIEAKSFYNLYKAMTHLDIYIDKMVHKYICTNN